MRKKYCSLHMKFPLKHHVFWPLSTQGTVSLILDVFGTFMSSLTEGNEQFAGGRLQAAQQTF